MSLKDEIYLKIDRIFVLNDNDKNLLKKEINNILENDLIELSERLDKVYQILISTLREKKGDKHLKQIINEIIGID